MIAERASERGRARRARPGVAAAVAVPCLLAAAAATVAVTVTVAAAAVGHAAAPPAGCGKDTDCKGARICLRGTCADPPLPPGTGPVVFAAPHTGPAGARDGGGPPAYPAAPERMQGPAPPGASPMFHGSFTHAGRSPYQAPATAPTPHGRRAVTGGAVVSSPALTADGTAIFGSHDHTVRAVRPDGTTRWTHRTDDLVWCSPAIARDGRSVYVGSDDDHLYALDLADGSERWKYRAGACQTATSVGPESSRCDVDGVTVGPDGTIYLVADGLYALHPDGSLLYRFGLATHCAGAPALGPDAAAYIGCQDGAIYAVNPDGTKRWDFRTGDDVDSSPALAPDGTLYAGSDDGKLYALTPAGTMKWAVQTGGPVHASPALSDGGTVYVGSFDGALYAVRPSGVVAFVFHAADRIVSSPLVDGAGAVLFGSEDDRLYALEADGKLRWSVLLGGDVDGTPALGADGTVFVGADDKSLHLLR